jgi:hypothetical protein
MQRVGQRQTGQLPMLTLGEVLDRLYDSEINHALIAEWDNGFLVRLGDEMNGWFTEAYVRSAARGGRMVSTHRLELCALSQNTRLGEISLLCRYSVTALTNPGNGADGHQATLVGGLLVSGVSG